MSKYRKLVAAIVGVVAMLLGPSFLGVSPGDQVFGVGQGTVVQLVVGVMTATGVFAVRNDPDDGE